MNGITQMTTWAIGLMFCFVPLGAQASDNIDPLICAVQETVDCGYQQTCLSGDAESLNIPVLFFVDFDEKIIQAQHGDGTTQITRIDHLEVLEEQWVLHGFEKRAWNLTIFKPDYRFSGSAIELDAVLGMFGGCTLQESLPAQ